MQRRRKIQSRMRGEETSRKRSRSQFDAPTVENSMEVPQKIKNSTTIYPSNPTSGYLSEEIKNTNLKRYMPSYVHGSIIYNSQNKEAIDNWTKKMWCLYKMEY